MPGVYARVTAASIFIVVIAIALGFAGPDLTNLALQKLTYAREKIIGRMDRHPTIVVVGSGLAGSCAALAAADANLNARIILLEKEVKTGGNSMKASSGINALDPEHDDSIEDFISDTMASGGGRSNAALVETLVRDSPGALAYLRSLGVELAGTVQLGGHTNPRTHFPAKGPNIGAAILRVLGHKLAEADRIQIITGAKVDGLILEGSRVAGVRYIANGTQHSQAAEAVILACGGFGANRQLIERHAPQFGKLATTNGPFALGEGLALAQAAGAQLIDLDQVQVHPTGFLDPKDPENSVKFLAPEKLRGMGGILLNQEGKRFVNELTTRDTVARAILSQPGAQALLLLGQDSAQRFGMPAIDFYCARGLMTKAATVEEAAAGIGITAAALTMELEAYNAAARTGNDALGKHVFPATVDTTGPLFLARVVPVIHYTMGGARIDTDGRVLKADGSPVPGLFGAGEVTGGVHGANRLAGNSLLECCVFGLRAGKAAAATAAALKAA